MRLTRALGAGFFHCGDRYMGIVAGGLNCLQLASSKERIYLFYACESREFRFKLSIFGIATSVPPQHGESAAEFSGARPITGACGLSSWCAHFTRPLLRLYALWPPSRRCPGSISFLCAARSPNATSDMSLLVSCSLQAGERAMSSLGLASTPEFDF